MWPNIRVIKYKNILYMKQVDKTWPKCRRPTLIRRKYNKKKVKNNKQGQYLFIKLMVR